MLDDAGGVVELGTRGTTSSVERTEVKPEPLVQIEISEGGPGTDQPLRRRNFHTRSIETTHIPCSNPGCLFGGFDVAALVREMRQFNERECLRVEICEGVRTGGEGTAPFVRCQHLFRVHLKLI